MGLGKYITREVKPTIAANLADADAALTANDVVFDWTAFTLPNGVNRLLGVTVIAPPTNAGASQDFPLDLLFATNTKGNGGVAAGAKPQSIGTISSAAAPTASPYFNDLIGAVKLRADDFTDTEPRSIGIADGTASENPVIFESYGTTPDDGQYTFYIAATTPDTQSLQSLVNIVGGGSAIAAGSSATVTVEAQDARSFFAPGDVIHGAGNEILGTVSTITNATTIVLTTPTVEELADDVRLYNINPIRLILTFER
tara:strand:- start:453 stop:1220 length:768 start_codon:yes stop_codon:yes gene_type:complete